MTMAAKEERCRTCGRSLRQGKDLVFVWKGEAACEDCHKRLWQESPEESKRAGCQIKCGHCPATLEIPSDWNYELAECPTCGRWVRVPRCYRRPTWWEAFWRITSEEKAALEKRREAASQRRREEMAACEKRREAASQRRREEMAALEKRREAANQRRREELAACEKRREAANQRRREELAACEKRLRDESEARAKRQREEEETRRLKEEEFRRTHEPCPWCETQIEKGKTVCPSCGCPFGDAAAFETWKLRKEIERLRKETVGQSFMQKAASMRAWLWPVCCLLIISCYIAYVLADQNAKRKKEAAAAQLELDRKIREAQLETERKTREALLEVQRTEEETEKARALVGILARWKDGVELADATGWIGLSGPVNNLQAIRRDLESLSVPESMVGVTKKLVAAMDKRIDGYLLFMEFGGERGRRISRDYFREAEELWGEASREAQKLCDKLEKEMRAR